MCDVQCEHCLLRGHVSSECPFVPVEAPSPTCTEDDFLDARSEADSEYLDALDSMSIASSRSASSFGTRRKTAHDSGVLAELERDAAEPIWQRLERASSARRAAGAAIGANDIETIDCSVSHLARAVEHFYVADPISQTRREIEREEAAFPLPEELVDSPLSARYAQEKALQRGIELAGWKMAAIRASDSVPPIESATANRLAMAEAKMRAHAMELERIEMTLRMRQIDATDQPPALQDLSDQLEHARRAQQQAAKSAVLEQAEEAARHRAETNALGLTLAESRKKSAETQAVQGQQKVAPSALALARERYEILNDESRRLQAEATIVACTLASERRAFLEVQQEEQQSRWEVANSLAHALAKEAVVTENLAHLAAVKLDGLEKSHSQEVRMAELLQRQERLRKKRAELAHRPIDAEMQLTLRAISDSATAHVDALERSTRSEIAAQIAKRKLHVQSVCNARLVPQAERNATLADEHMNTLVEEKRRHLAELLAAKQSPNHAMEGGPVIREEWRPLLPQWSRHLSPPSPAPPLSSATGPFSVVLPRVRVSRIPAVDCLSCTQAQHKPTYDERVRAPAICLSILVRCCAMH